MYYYKMKQGSKGLELFLQYKNSPRRWYESDIRKEIENLLEINIEDNLGITERGLYLVNPSEKYIKQFKSKKENDFYIARKDSKLQKAYIKLCEKYNLRVYNLSEFWLDTNLTEGDGFSIYRKRCIKQIIPVYKDWYLESNTRELDNFDWLELVDEIEFLELRSKFLKEKNN